MTPMILVIDDDVTNLKVIKTMLLDVDCKVVCFDKPFEGLSFLQENHSEVSAILLDKMMPEINGIDILIQMSKESKYQQIPVIMQTAAGSEQDMIEGIKVGAFRYLTKPFTEDELKLSIDKALHYKDGTKTRFKNH